MIAEEVMKAAPFDVAYIIFNYFGSVVSFRPTVANVYSSKALEACLGEALDLYEFEDGKSESLEVRNCHLLRHTPVLIHTLDLTRYIPHPPFP